MKFNVKRNLTEARIRVSEAAAVIMTPVEGNIRINPAMAEAMNIPYEIVNTDSKDDAGVRMDFKVINDETGAANYVAIIINDGSKEGAKLGSPNRKTAGSLTANQSTVWATMKGEKGFTTVWGIKTLTIGQADDESFITPEAAKAAGLLTEDNKWTAGAVAQGFCEAEDEGKVVNFAAVLYMAEKVPFIARKKKAVVDGVEVEIDSDDIEDDGEEFAAEQF